MVDIIQLNPTVGAVDANANKIIDGLTQLKSKIVVTGEGATTGYPVGDLLIDSTFLRSTMAANRKITKLAKNYLIFGTLTKEGKKIYNTALLCHKGKIIGRYKKRRLQDKSFFAETKYFSPGSEIGIFKIDKKKVGILFYDEIDDLIEMKNRGVKDVFVLGCCPYFIDMKWEKRLVRIAKKTHLNIYFTNLVGGQDQLVFEGCSSMVGNTGKVLYRASGFKEIFEPVRKGKFYKRKMLSDLMFALILGIRDYVEKNRFEKVIIGISGGVDSALTAALATLALGPQNVVGAILPGPFSSNQGQLDALELAKNLRIKIITIKIDPIYLSYLDALELFFKNTEFGITEENIQARIRGNLLMAFSNKFGYLVLSTGNRSESAVGYATLYGDLAGGFAPLSDISKKDVYRLSNYINRKFKRKMIPSSSIKKPPSAELRPGQRDEDDLPPYSQLDQILELYLDRGLSGSEIIKKGFDKKVVKRIINLVRKGEFKRRQAPVGIKVHRRTFGNGIVLPITMRW